MSHHKNLIRYLRPSLEIQFSFNPEFVTDLCKTLRANILGAVVPCSCICRFLSLISTATRPIWLWRIHTTISIRMHPINGMSTRRMRGSLDWLTPPVRYIEKLHMFQKIPSPRCWDASACFSADPCPRSKPCLLHPLRLPSLASKKQVFFWLGTSKMAITVFYTILMVVQNLLENRVIDLRVNILQVVSPDLGTGIQKRGRESPPWLLEISFIYSL